MGKDYDVTKGEYGKRLFSHLRYMGGPAPQRNEGLAECDDQAGRHILQRMRGGGYSNCDPEAALAPYDV